MKHIRFVGSLAILLCTAPAAAQTQVFQTVGQQLRLTGNRFTIQSISFSGNICDLEGVFQRRGNRAVFDDGQGCRVHFRFHSHGVQVAADENDACRQYCGHNAVMSGDYRTLPAACTEAGLAGSERRFLAAYRTRRFAEAVRIKQQRLEQCEGFMWFFDRLSERSDLAIAHKNAGNQAACRRSLQPFADEIEGRADFTAPAIWRSEYENALKAARFNWQLCAPH